MQLKTITLIIFITAIIGLGFSSFVGPAQGYKVPIHDELLVTGHDFTGGNGTGFAFTANGLTIASSAFTAVYTSPEIEATIPFNVIVPQWKETLPEGTSLTIQIRTRAQNGTWSRWYVMHENHDLGEYEGDWVFGNMIAVPEIDETHTHIQFSASLGRTISLNAPVLEEISFTLIDATAGPSTEELIAQQQRLDAQPTNKSYQVVGNPRPTVISREVWCIYDDCNYTAGLEYAPATHMVVHHTVSANGGTNWAATVRAIWSFHTNTRGWGDIGYNYLIDVDGLIYEGHMNEDYENLDVKGTHAAGANLGSMGVSLLGTFTAVDYPGLPGIEPPEPMVNSLVNLLSWKANQRSIDVYDASDALPDIDWGLPTLMGHRDTYGTTECPGDQAYALLPEIRDRVAANISLTNPYLMVDETGPYFTRSNSNWYEGPNECGTNGHSYYTWSTTDPAKSTNWGEWRPPIAENGRYRIEVRVPYCSTGRNETGGATYTITHANGSDTVTVSHEAELGLWIDLGEYNLLADGSTVVRLTDLTTTDNDLGIWFDDMRLLPLPPQLTIGTPTTGHWTNEPNVEFSWQLSSGDPQTNTLKVATDSSLSNLVIDEVFSGDVISYTHVFTEDVSLYWQTSVVLTGTQDVLTSTISNFGVDTAVPTTTPNLIYKNYNDFYNLFWTGSDNLSGVAGYDVAYRTISETTWTGWLTTTLNTTAVFNPPDPDQTYQFRIIATDHAGNVETKTEPDFSTAEAMDLPHAIMLPLIRK